jgi:hypothetical protein
MRLRYLLRGLLVALVLLVLALGLLWQSAFPTISEPPQEQAVDERGAQ